MPVYSIFFSVMSITYDVLVITGCVCVVGYSEKISRDPLFNPKTMGLRTAEVRELRSTSPIPPASLNFRHNGPSVPMGRGTGHMYRSSINISTIPQQQPLRQHNKRFSASAMALHSNYMYSSPKG